MAEVTVRQYVRERKQELGWSTRATCVPQSYEWGQEGQVDWYERFRPILEKRKGRTSALNTRISPPPTAPTNEAKEPAEDAP